MKKMNFDQLQHFFETARLQHMGKAAKILRVSPSGISYSIECLERDLDVRLFRKVGRRIFLTAAGQRLLDKIPHLFKTLSDLESHVTESNPKLDGYYRVAGSHVLSDSILAPVVANFIQEYPKASLDVFSLRSSHVIEQVLNSQLDFGVCFNPQQHPKLVATVLKKGMMFLYVRKKHPVLKTKSPIKALSSFPSILPKAFGGIEVCDTHPVFKSHNLVPTNRIAIDNYYVAINLVKNSDSWGFFPEFIEELPGNDLVRVKPTQKWKAAYSVCGIFTKDRMENPVVRYLIEKLSQQ